MYSVYMLYYKLSWNGDFIEYDRDNKVYTSIDIFLENRWKILNDTNTINLCLLQWIKFMIIFH